MKDNYCDITLVLDRSGSMANVIDDTIGGFNSFLQSQKALSGECTFTMVQFDTDYDFVHKAVTLTDVPPLNIKTFVPRGGTALLDAIGRAITETGARLAAMPEADCPSKVLFIIQTDGEENSSKEYTRPKVFEMISHQQDVYKWEFVFLGANQDAISAGASLGVKLGKSITYASNAAGSASAYESISTISTSYRTTGFAPDFTQKDRDDQTAAGASPSNLATNP